MDQGHSRSEELLRKQREEEEEKKREEERERARLLERNRATQARNRQAARVRKEDVIHTSRVVFLKTDFLKESRRVSSERRARLVEEVEERRRHLDERQQHLLMLEAELRVRDDVNSHK